MAPVLGVTVLLCGIAAPGCSDNPSGPSGSNPALTEITTTAHYTIHSAPGDTVDTAWQDASATFDDAPSVTEARVLAADGRSLSSMWDEWLAWISSPV